MIIATIGHQKYKLKDITAAEQLLKIINESVPVDDHYISGKPTVYAALNTAPEMKLSIVQGDLITDEELDRLNAANLKSA